MFGWTVPLTELRHSVCFASSDLCAFLTQTYARPEATAAGHTQYAANVTGRLLEFYEKLFEISYQQNTLGKTWSWNDGIDELMEVKRVIVTKIWNSNNKKQ